MKSIKYLAAVLVASSFPAAAQAQDSGAYGVIGAATFDFDNYGLDAKLGYNFNRNFGVEVQGILGLTSDSAPLSNAPNSATLKLKDEYAVGAFAVARLPLNEQFEIFARGGIHNSKYNVKINNALNTDYDVEKTGVAVSAGAQFNLDTQNAIRADYTYLDGIDSNIVSIGYVRKF